MRRIGSLHPTNDVTMAPDTVVAHVMTGGSSAQSGDWLSTGSTVVANASVSASHIVRVTGTSTAAVPIVFGVNLGTTGAYIGTSGSSIAAAVTHLVNGTGMFQVSADSTGYSLASLIAGYITVEQWRR